MNISPLEPLTICFSLCHSGASTLELDLLQPYLTHHGPLHRRQRDTVKCQHVRYGNTTYSMHPVHKNISAAVPVVEIQHKLAKIGQYVYQQRDIVFRYQRVFNPLQTFSILEPKHPGTCRNGSQQKATVQESAMSRNCIVAANGGFFNTHTGECLGENKCHNHSTTFAILTLDSAKS